MASLKESWDQFNHVRHTLMDVNMIVMAVGAVVATGGAFGWFDWIGPFVKMHFSSLPDIFTNVSGYVSGAEGVVSENIFSAGAEHAGHAGHAAVPASPTGAPTPDAGMAAHGTHGPAAADSGLSHNHACTDQGNKFADWSLKNPDKLPGLSEDAGIVGMKPYDYFGQHLCHG